MKRLLVSCFLALTVIVPLPATAADMPPPTLDLLTAAGASSPLDGHVVYVDFWASWCVPCRASFPWMEKMAATHADDGLRVITVNLDRKADAMRRFIEAHGVTVPVVEDPEGKLARAFGVEAMPTSFVFDRSGTLRFRHEGFRPKDAGELEARLVDLMEETPARAPNAGAAEVSP